MKVFYYLAHAMIGGGVVGAAHGAVCGWFTSHDVSIHMIAKAAEHGLAAMLLTPIAPIMMIRQVIGGTACPTLKSLMK